MILTKIKYSLLLTLLLFLTENVSAQFCNCATGCSGLPSGFSNCIEVTSTVDNTTITSGSTSDGSLRWALLKATSLTGGTYIKFNIPGTGTKTITLTAALPIIWRKVFIDGSTQGEKPVISGGTGTYVFNFTSDGVNTPEGNSIVKNIVIRNSYTGIRLASNSNKVTNCVLNTTNLCLAIEGSANNIVVGCDIGYVNTNDVPATIPDAGIGISNSNNTIIGGIAEEDRNVIYGKNAGIGMSYSHYTQIYNNIIGLDRSGTKPMGPSPNYYTYTYGISVVSSNYCIIGGEGNKRNIISNWAYGMNLSSVGYDYCNYLDIRNNYFGTDITGITPIFNVYDINGVTDNSNIKGNIFAGSIDNIDGGVWLFGNHNTIQGNYFGTNESMDITYGSAHGSYLYIFNDDNLIGGTSPGDGNVFIDNDYGHNFIGYVNFPINIYGVRNKISRNKIIFLENNLAPFEPLLGIDLKGTVGNNGKLRPSVTSFPSNSIQGTSQPNDIVEVFLSNYSTSPKLHGKNSITYMGTAIANGSGAWMLNRADWADPAFVISGTVVFIATATDADNNTSEFSDPFTYTCTSISFTGLPNIVCPDAPAITLTGIPSGGSFSGAGVSGNTFTPSSVAAGGTYAVTYSYTTSVPSNCPTTYTQQIAISRKSPGIDRVLATTATTYTDSWLQDFSKATELSPARQKIMAERNFYSSSVKGLWKPEENYVYVDNRNQDPAIKLRTDGIMNDVPMFIWSNGNMGGCYLGWRKISTATRYTTNSSVKEERDILNLYSTALYGYKGDLMTAVAANSTEGETAFDGFEEYTAGSAVLPKNLATGNFSFYTQAPSATDFDNQVYRSYEVEISNGNALTVLAQPQELAPYIGKRVKYTGSFLTKYDVKDIRGVTNLTSASAYGSDPNRTSVVLSTDGFNWTGIWKGRISFVKNTDIIPFTSMPTSISISESYAHTGKNSLYLNGQAEFEQYRLNVKAGKKYVLSYWVKSTAVNDSLTYATTSGARGFKARFFDATGTFISESTVIQPSGIKVEGWQRGEDSFLAPAGTAQIRLVMNSDTGPVYIDDVRFFPFEGNMKSYVYYRHNYKLRAELDNNNYATFYYYDEEGNLFLLKKETERGIQTIKESMSNTKKRN